MKLIKLYFDLWFITLPLTYIILNGIYFLILELLDLVLNTNKINKLLRVSDSLDLDKYEELYQFHLFRKENLDQSDLLELELRKDKSAKALYDIFKV